MFDVRMLNVAIELWGVVFSVMGLASVLLLTRAYSRYRSLLLAMFASELVLVGGDAVAGIFRGQEGTLAWAGTHVGNFCGYAGGFALMGFLIYYICKRVEEVGGPDMHRWAAGVAAGAVVMCALALLGVFYYIDDANLYHRSDWYWIGQMYIFTACLVNAALLLRCRKELGTEAFVALLFFSLVPALSTFGQILVYGLNYNAVASVVGMIVVFLEMQRHSSQTIVERTEELAAARVEASESRIAAMVSQIQPHFLFNTLNTIYSMVDPEDEKAREALASFSHYLRANLESLKRTRPVPVVREMEHVRTYLELERMSDEGRLEYELDVQATDFEVPALSVQTLAENAVKHGLGGREQGGRVVVRTREQSGEFTVAVADDGVGFDAADESAWGVGLQNTRSRLEAMCGATLEVTSEPGAGTTAVVHVPKDPGAR